MNSLAPATPPPAAPSDNTTAPPTAAAVPMAPVAALLVELPFSVSTDAKKNGDGGGCSSFTDGGLLCFFLACNGDIILPS